MAEPTGRPETAVRVVSARGVLAPVRRGDAAATASRRETSEKAPRTRPNARGAVAREERLAGLDVASEGREGRKERTGGERRRGDLLVGLKLDRRGLLRRGREGEGRGGEERDGELHFYVPVCRRGEAVRCGNRDSLSRRRKTASVPFARAVDLGALSGRAPAARGMGDRMTPPRPSRGARPGSLGALLLRRALRPHTSRRREEELPYFHWSFS